MNLIKVSKLCLVDVRQKFKSLTPSGKYQLSKISSVEYRRFSLWKGFTILVNTLESIIKELISVNSWHEACAWHTYPLTQETDGSIFYGMKILQKVHIKAGDIHVFINLKTGVITIQWGRGGREARGKTQAGGRTCNGKWITWTLCSSLPTPTGYGAHIN